MQTEKEENLATTRSERGTCEQQRGAGGRAVGRAGGVRRCGAPHCFRRLVLHPLQEAHALGEFKGVQLTSVGTMTNSMSAARMAARDRNQGPSCLQGFQG